MTIDQAKESISNGGEFGAVFVQLSEGDGHLLKEWYVREPTVPAVKLRPKLPPPQTGTAMRAAAKAAGTPTGNPCPHCGGANAVRTGSCITCLDCGTNEGCG